MRRFILKDANIHNQGHKYSIFKMKDMNIHK